MIFLVWMLFFDQDNIIRQYKLTQELNDARARNEYLKKNYSADSALLHKIETDTETKIKIAREEYMMKKDDEQVIVIIDNTEK
jgi:cell division protein FtsB